MSGVFLSNRPCLHKLPYAKTAKADPAAALAGVVINTLVGYFSLSSLGWSSVSMSDLSVAMVYFFLLISGALSVGRGRWSMAALCL